MKTSSTWYIYGFLAIGLIFHLVYIFSVFDCYFTSSVIDGMESYSLETAESRRLVLIVGDGLRADLLFSLNSFPSVPEAPEIVAPYLRSIVETRGAFGISHTRVPTESRPGHVALIAGMYEYISSVAKVWETDQVDFDSVFNQSSHTFSFGSPEILLVFAQAATPGKVKSWYQNNEDQDYTKDATALDLWVLDRLRSLLINATHDAALNSQLRSEKAVFFLHLPGIDTTGHSYRPHSREYMNNIQVVDDIVRQTEALFSDFFEDDETSFIFTADHGMSAIGNHGDGDPDNTRTPLIAWGRGIRGPLLDSSPSSHDDYSKLWGLSHLLRRDIEQADVAALMSAILGTNWPKNSVGVLPDVDPTRPGYLLPAKGDETLARAALVNARVILDHYRLQHELKQARAFFYDPFPGLEDTEERGTSPILLRIAEIERSIQNEEWYTARKQSAALVQSGLDGLRYLQTYDRLLIQIIATAAYTGWAVYTSLFIFGPLDVSASKKTFRSTMVITSFVISSLIGFWAFFALQKSPWTFYLYIAFPCYFWQQSLVQIVPILRSIHSVNYIKVFGWGALVVAVLQSMIVAYTHRAIWSIGFVFIGLIWPVLSWPGHPFPQRCLLRFVWAAACLVTGVFPLLSVVRQESLMSILFGGVGILVIGGISAGLVLSQTGRVSNLSLVALFATQLLLIASITGITASSVTSLQARSGLPVLNHLGGWFVLVSASFLPFVSLPLVKHHSPYSKMLMYFLGFGPCFVILSVSMEGLFYLAYSITLVIWVEVEAVLRGTLSAGKSSSQGTYQFQPDDLRIAMFFLFFIHVGFFGSGNVASLSSFYLEPIFRLVTIYNPPLVAALLLFKVVSPYVILSVTFAALHKRLHLPPFSLFLLALALADGMTVTFFFNVSDDASWLEIGQSISFFCVASLLLILSATVCAAGEYLMADWSARTVPPFRVNGLKAD